MYLATRVLDNYHDLVFGVAGDMWFYERFIESDLDYDPAVLRTVHAECISLCTMEVLVIAVNHAAKYALWSSMISIWWVSGCLVQESPLCLPVFQNLWATTLSFVYRWCMKTLQCMTWYEDVAVYDLIVILRLIKRLVVSSIISSDWDWGWDCRYFFTKGLPNESHWKHTNALLKKLPEHVIASSEAAESSSSMNVPEEEKHDGGVLFEGSPDGSDEVDAKLFRPLGYWVGRGGLVIEVFVVVFPLAVSLVHPLVYSLAHLLVY